MLQGIIFRVCPAPKGALFVRMEIKVSSTLKWKSRWLLYLVIVDVAFASWYEDLIFITFQSLILDGRACLEYEIAREFGLSTLGSGEQVLFWIFPVGNCKKRRFSSVLSYLTRHNFLLFIVMHLCSSEVFSYLELFVLIAVLLQGCIFTNMNLGALPNEIWSSLWKRLRELGH